MGEEQQTNNQEGSQQTNNQEGSQQTNNQGDSTSKPELIPLVQELLVLERKDDKDKIITETARPDLTRQNNDSSNTEKK